MVRHVPVVVGVSRAVPTLCLLQEVDELDLIQLEVSYEAGLLVQVERQHRQALAFALLVKAKHIKMPVAFCILQHIKRAFTCIDKV